MERHHVATFRRESGAVTRDPNTGKTSKAAVALATGVPCIVQFDGKVVPGPAGEDVQINAMLFVAAADLPSGVELEADDHVELTAGRRSHSLYRVHAVNPATSRDGYFDDELMLVDTLEVLSG